jgi:chemotaxis protein methyltransferase CheR
VRNLSPQIFAILNSLIEEHTGIHYSIEDKELLGDKVAGRAAEAGFTSLLDYYYFLRYDDSDGTELSALIDALVVNETYLFRGLPPLEVMVDEMVALIGAGRRPRIWSAACSTGEEPLTIAMLLAARGLLDQVELVASDISQRTVGRARAGQLSKRAVRNGTPAFAAPWLVKTAERVTPDPRLLRSIAFHQINLLDGAAIAALGQFDAIVCRNVFIYFSRAKTRTAVGHLTGALRPGAPLLVDIAESLLQVGTSLLCEEHRGVFIYRKAHA